MDICYNTDNSIVCAFKPSGSSWGLKETDGNPLKVITLDLTQDELDCLNDNMLAISDGQITGCIIVDDVTTPTSISKVI
jgi:hypothetical protein